ncbi:hypothetical protein FRC12_018604 [Ceratobasidium sp. 428]|nr:hypothetical protein FRC12_018604 [Ceratobasidium sp. 428]
MKFVSILVSALVLPLAALAAPTPNTNAPGEYGGPCGGSNGQCQESMCCWNHGGDSTDKGVCVTPKSDDGTCSPTWIWSYSLVKGDD